MKVVNGSSITTQVSGEIFWDGFTFLICTTQFFRRKESQCQFKVYKSQSTCVTSVQTEVLLRWESNFSIHDSLMFPSVWSTKPTKPWSGDGKSSQEYMSKDFVQLLQDWMSANWGVPTRSESEAENDVNSENKWQFWIDMIAEIPKTINRTQKSRNRPSK